MHESPLVMTVPLFILAIGAVFAGWLGYNTFVGSDMDAFWGASLLVLEGHNTVEAAHHVPLWVKLAPIVVGVVGIALAYVIYMLRMDLPAGIAKRRATPVCTSSCFNKWYFDELYDWLFVRPALRLGRFFWKTGDGDIIDGAIRTAFRRRPTSPSGRGGAIGIRLSLRLRDVDRGGGDPILVSDFPRGLSAC